MATPRLTVPTSSNDNHTFRLVLCHYWNRLVHETRHCEHFPNDICAGQGCPGPHHHPFRTASTNTTLHPTQHTD